MSRHLTYIYILLTFLHAVLLAEALQQWLLMTWMLQIVDAAPYMLPYHNFGRLPVLLQAPQVMV